MEVVKGGMGHGDLSMEAYSQVWEECYGQVSTHGPKMRSQRSINRCRDLLPPFGQYICHISKLLVCRNTHGWSVVQSNPTSYYTPSLPLMAHSWGVDSRSFSPKLKCFELSFLRCASSLWSKTLVWALCDSVSSVFHPPHLPTGIICVSANWGNNNLFSCYTWAVQALLK